jgi:hypothetical protein
VSTTRRSASSLNSYRIAATRHGGEPKRDIVSPTRISSMRNTLSGSSGSVPARYSSRFESGHRRRGLAARRWDRLDRIRGAVPKGRACRRHRNRSRAESPAAASWRSTRWDHCRRRPDRRGAARRPAPRRSSARAVPSSNGPDRSGSTRRRLDPPSGSASARDSEMVSPALFRFPSNGPKMRVSGGTLNFARNAASCCGSPAGSKATTSRAGAGGSDAPWGR